MKKEITLGQLFGGCITVIVAVLTAWITLNNKVTANSERIKAIEDRFERNDLLMMRVEQKVDKLMEQNAAIQAIIEKKNR